MAAASEDGVPEMDEAMRRRARMMRKFTQLRESIAEEQPQPEHRPAGQPQPERDDGRARGVPNWLDALAHCLTGGVAGILANALIFPIDVAKTRMQVEMPIFPPGLRGVALVRSFYHGLVLGSLETGAVHASSFLFYDYLKGRWIRRRLGRGLEVRRSPSRAFAHTKLRHPRGCRLQPGEEAPAVPIGIHLLLGVIASLGTQHVTLPLKVLLIRIQGGSNSGLLDAARAVVSETGWLGFWTGSRATLWMATNPALTYVVYERLQRLASDRNRAAARPSGADGRGEDAAEPSSTTSTSTVQESQATASQNFLAGWLAKAVATVCTFPVQKTQAMVQARPAQFNGSQLAAIQSVLFAGTGGPGSEHTGGLPSLVAVLGLWRGLGPKLMQAALQQALIFRIKELLTKPALLAVHRWYHRRTQDRRPKE